MGVCHQVTFLILHYITSKLVLPLKVIDAPVQVPNVLDLTVSIKFLDFNSQICLLFVPKMSANFTSYIVTYTTHTYTNTRNEHPCPQWGLKSRSQQSGGCRLHLILHGHCISVLDAFAKRRKFTISLVLSLCPSAWSYSSSHWTDLHET